MSHQPVHWLLNMADSSESNCGGGGGEGDEPNNNCFCWCQLNRADGLEPVLLSAKLGKVYTEIVRVCTTTSCVISVGTARTRHLGVQWADRRD